MRIRKYSTESTSSKMNKKITRWLKHTEIIKIKTIHFFSKKKKKTVTTSIKCI